MDRFEQTKLRIKEATDLVALIESYMPLKPRGRNYVACCPFHAENTPSFAVNREGQYFKCFGCGKSGDVFTWLQERDGLTFRQAMEVLAERAGISLEGVFQQREERRGPDPSAVLSEVAGLFRRLLEADDGDLARDYLQGRGLEAAIDSWCLGYHAPGALLQFLREKRPPLEVLEAAGLVRNGREIFAGRLMFPIENELGRIVGFGGRVVPGAPGSEARGDYTPPKYLNSPESPFFNKRRVLFGLPHCKRAGQRRIVVVEGYTDVIACHLAGFQGAVASLGTAFTAEHARLVERYATDGLVLMFDADRAGRQAGERAMRELVNAKVPVRIAVMRGVDAGGVKDPADFVAARPGDDPEELVERRARFADIVDGAEDPLTVWFRLLRLRLDFQDPAHLERVAGECTSLLSLVENPVRRAAYQQEMARHLAVPEPEFVRLLQKAPRPARSRAADGAAARDEAPERIAVPAPTTPAERAEFELLACVLARPACLVGGEVPGGVPVGFPALAELCAMAIEGVAVGRQTRAELLSYLFVRVGERAELRSLLGLLAERAATIPDVEGVLAGLVDARRRLHNEPELRSLRQQVEQALAAGDRAAADALQDRWLSTMRRHRPRSVEAQSTPHPQQAVTQQADSQQAPSQKATRPRFLTGGDSVDESAGADAPPQT